MLHRLSALCFPLATAVALLAAAPSQQIRSEGDTRIDESTVDIDVESEVAVFFRAGCERCDWGVAGREAAALRVAVDGAYSQHVLLYRGEKLEQYGIMLGRLPAGTHRVTFERDEARSAKGAGRIAFRGIQWRAVPRNAESEFEVLARAPFIHARPGTVERFTDIPILMWAEHASPQGHGYRYSVIFTHEDGGTPTDRLMATWGRTTDIEYAYSFEGDLHTRMREEIQAKDHEILPFRGERLTAHPLLWVSTHNNMFSDSGAKDLVRFAPYPMIRSLDNGSREIIMDRDPWTYAVMAAELRREGRLDPNAQPGSGKVPDPRTFAYLEACGTLDRATLAFDVGVSGEGAPLRWFASDRGDARFRIARDGCFRSAVPLAPGVRPDQLGGIRIRAYTRPPREGEPALPPGTGRVTLTRFNTAFMLDDDYTPVPSGLNWTGTIEARGESEPVRVPVR